MSCSPFQCLLRNVDTSTRDIPWQQRETKTYQEEPRQGAPEQHLQVPPFPIMRNKVGPRRPGHIEVHLRRLLGPGPRKLVHLPLAPLALAVCGDIFHGLLDVPLDVKGIARRLGNGQAEVEREAPRHRSKSAQVSSSVICTHNVTKALGSSMCQSCWESSIGESHTQQLPATFYRQH